jgi:hypothetical protein
MATLAPDRPLGGPASRDSDQAHVAYATTINADPATVLDRLRDPQTVGAVFACSEAPRVTGGAEGVSITFDADDAVDADGALFITANPAPGDRGALVNFVLPKEKPYGFFGKMLARFKDDSPETAIARASRRLKQLVEAGEIATAARTRAQLAEERN